MSQDAEQLSRYVKEKSESAFAELVRRHLDFVYGVALRRVGGNASLAEDVTQSVFTDVARKAKSLVDHPSLSAWLFRSTRFAAAQAMRCERRRLAREREAHLMHELTHGSVNSPDWDQLKSTIDDVIDELPENDRVAVGLRFFEGRTFAEVGAKLAASEDAARVRVDRALQKIRLSLARRGIKSTSGALATALASQSAAAPAHLTVSVTSAAVTAAATASTGFFASLGTLAAMKSTSLVLAGSLVANAIFVTMYSTSSQSGPPPADGAIRVDPTFNLSELLDTEDLPTLIARLRAAGFPNSAIRAIVEAKLNQRYDRRLRELVSDSDLPFWKPSTPGETARRGNERLRLIAERSRIMRELLGNFAVNDDGNLTPEQRRQYGNLSSAKVDELERIKADYEEMARAATVAMNGITLPEDRERLALLEREKRADLAALLSPQELEDYDMRNSPITASLRPAFALFKATEEEFRAIYAIQRSGGDAAQMRATLGDRRYSEFERAKDRDYQQLARFAEREGLPLEAANPVYGLRDQAAAESARISGDPALSTEQKIAALQSLVQNVRLQVVATLGQNAGESYGKTANWVMSIERNAAMIRATAAASARRDAVDAAAAPTSPAPTQR